MSGGETEAGARRAAVFARMRRGLAVAGEDAPRKAIVRGRLENHPRGLIPQRGQLAPARRVELFIRMAEAVQASVERVSRKADVLAAVTTFLRRHDLRPALVHGADAYIAGLDWAKHKALLHRAGRAEPADAVSLARALAAVAETGTLVMASGPDNPVTLNFLPYNEIVLVEAGDVVGDYETVWDRLREKFGEGRLPRTVNWISGPSRSADIGQQLNLGAHGPGRLHIIIVG